LLGRVRQGYFSLGQFSSPWTMLRQVMQVRSDLAKMGLLGQVNSGYFRLGHVSSVEARKVQVIPR